MFAMVDVGVVDRVRVERRFVRRARIGVSTSRSFHRVATRCGARMTRRSSDARFVRTKPMERLRRDREIDRPSSGRPLRGARPCPKLGTTPSVAAAARISAFGSTPITSKPRVEKGRDEIPVPEPMSATRCAAARARPNERWRRSLRADTTGDTSRSPRRDRRNRAVDVGHFCFRIFFEERLEADAHHRVAARARIGGDFAR